MSRLFNRFVLVLSLLLAAGYSYLSARLVGGFLEQLLLLVPFVCVWIVPVVYWVNGRDGEQTRWDECVHMASYLSMGWLNFALFLTLARDVVYLIASFFAARGLQEFLMNPGSQLVLIAASGALIVGWLVARRGPSIREVEVMLPDLDPALEGLRIVQISDLHAGPGIGKHYVQRVVNMANQLAPDLVALTGDLVDGSVAKLQASIAPLAELLPRERIFLVLGNHEYYSGIDPWIAHFRSLGIHVLLNESVYLSHRGASVHLGGVTDPAARGFQREEPRPEQAMGSGFIASGRRSLHILLAHHPKIAQAAARAGFDLQLSGHTHAGQFFPWTLAVRLVHAPHVFGLSQEGKMRVYVSAGTGTWGPPVRLGTKPELILLRLLRQKSSVSL